MTKSKFLNTSTYYNAAPESNFTLIPNQIIQARFLSAYARLLYMAIISKPKDYIINVERMYADLGIPQKSGAKAFRELEDCGLVNREKRGNSYHYDVSNFDYTRLDTPKLTGPIVSTTNTESNKTQIVNNKEEKLIYSEYEDTTEGNYEDDNPIDGQPLYEQVQCDVDDEQIQYDIDENTPLDDSSDGDSSEPSLSIEVEESSLDSFDDRAIIPEIEMTFITLGLRTITCHSSTRSNLPQKKVLDRRLADYIRNCDGTVRERLIKFVDTEGQYNFNQASLDILLSQAA